ncbi:MAG: hypothetical protein DRJ03_17735 [Chloroflexi bacterium]|nr:MAG: hypothetical protein DRJ03_17735 [Chloroflexota bacterium]
MEILGVLMIVLAIIMLPGSIKGFNAWLTHRAMERLRAALIASEDERMSMLAEGLRVMGPTMSPEMHRKYRDAIREVKASKRRLSKATHSELIETPPSS